MLEKSKIRILTKLCSTSWLWNALVKTERYPKNICIVMVLNINLQVLLFAFTAHENSEHRNKFHENPFTRCRENIVCKTADRWQHDLPVERRDRQTACETSETRRRSKWRCWARRKGNSRYKTDVELYTRNQTPIQRSCFSVILALRPRWRQIFPMLC